jgi:hypothetical protein
MNTLRKLALCGLAAAGIGLVGATGGCTMRARVYDPGGPYYGGYVFDPPYYQPGYPVYYYYDQPSIGVYYFDRDGRRHIQYDEHRRHDRDDRH